MDDSVNDMRPPENTSARQRLQNVYTLEPHKKTERKTRNNIDANVHDFMKCTLFTLDEASEKAKDRFLWGSVFITTKVTLCTFFYDYVIEIYIEVFKPIKHVPRFVYCKKRANIQLHANVYLCLQLPYLFEINAPQKIIIFTPARCVRGKKKYNFLFHAQ